MTDDDDQLVFADDVVGQDHGHDQTPVVLLVGKLAMGVTLALEE